MNIIQIQFKNKNHCKMKALNYRYSPDRNASLILPQLLPLWLCALGLGDIGILALDIQYRKQPQYYYLSQFLQKLVFYQCFDLFIDLVLQVPMFYLQQQQEHIRPRSMQLLVPTVVKFQTLSLPNMDTVFKYQAS